MEDLTKILAFEVKKEMADRYFGFRKRIEDDTDAYKQKLTTSSLELENKIGFDLIRIYILLQQESLIQDFIQLVDLPGKLFYDPYMLDSPTIRRRVFSGHRCRGFSRKRRFRNMFFDTYESLARHIEEYRSTIAELTEEQETIREEINLFYRKNDIDSIMSFIRRLDAPDPSTAGMMQTGRHDFQGQGLSGQLRLHPPLPACEMLPTIPSLPPLGSIRSQLTRLLNIAFRFAGDLDLKDVTRKPD